MFQATARHWRSAGGVHFRKYTLIIKIPIFQGSDCGIRLRKAPHKILIFPWLRFVIVSRAFTADEVCVPELWANLAAGLVVSIR